MHGTVGVFVADFDEPDPSDAYQIVGYQEYANALNNLVPLVRAADEASLRVYDKIISDMPELVIYTNLSRRFGLVQMQNFSLPPRSLLVFAYSKRGLRIRRRPPETICLA